MVIWRPLRDVDLSLPTRTEVSNEWKCAFSNSYASGVPRKFFREGGVQQIQLTTEDRDDGDLGAVAP